MRVEAAIVIEASQEQVFRFVAVPEQGPRWQESAVSTRVTTPGPVALGSEMEHEGRWLWMRIQTTAVVTVYEPPHRYRYDITSQLISGHSLKHIVASFAAWPVVSALRTQVIFDNNSAAYGANRIYIK